MKKLIALTVCFLYATGFNAQQLAIYEFSGGSTSVTTQPVNSYFASFITQNLTTVTSNGEHQTQHWPYGFTPVEYIEFKIHTINCHRFSLDSLVFNAKRSLNSGNPTTWRLRSSLDNFSSEMAGGNAQTYYTPVTLPFQAGDFDSLTNIAFRLYVTNINPGGYFYLDDFAVYGSEVLVGPVDYYLDNDFDGYGTGNPVQSSCDDLSDIYSFNNLDCNDNSDAINPATRWYADLDGDNFGDPDVSMVSCLQPLSYVYIDPYELSLGTALIDCNDNNLYINPDAFEDYCADGEDQNCDGVDGDPSVPMAHCDYIMDADGDGYGSGESVYAPCDCGADQFYFDLGYIFGTTADDCNDTVASIHPGAVDIPNNGIDEDCDGSGYFAALSENNIPDIAVFPNPGNDVINLPISVPGKRKVRISDNQGKIVFEQEVSKAGNYEINTSSFAKGGYQIELQSETGILRSSWVKL